MADDDKKQTGKPAGADPARPALPPFGLAQEILRQMATPDRRAPRASAPAAGASAAPMPAAPDAVRGRDSLLQFADAVMTATTEKPAASPDPEHHLVTFVLHKEEY